MAAGDLITADGQAEWRGVLLGAHTPFRLTGLTGWTDMPSIRVGDTPRDGYHGAVPGRHNADARTIELAFLATAVDIGAALEPLRRAVALAEDPVEEPLVIRLDGQRLMVLARCIRYADRIDKQYAVGHTVGAVQWVASNPRRLALPQQSASTLMLGAASGGLDFSSPGLNFSAPGLDFGTGATDGVILASNTGSAAAWPVFRITGPITGPVITNLDTGQQLAFNPAFTVGADETLEIDTHARTVRYSPSGVSRRYELFVNQWFPFLPGTTRVGFARGAGSYNATASLTALWHHTYL